MAKYSPTPEHCIEQWKHNRDFISTIEPAYHDWIITTTLYAALHAVETLLIADQVPNHASHAQRHQVLENNPRYSAEIWPAYKVMYDLAHITRYSARPRNWVRFNDIDAKIFGRCLYPLEAVLRKKLGELKPKPIVFPDLGKIVLKPVLPPTAAKA